MARRVRLHLLRSVRLLSRPWVGALLVALLAVLGCVGTGLAIGIPAPVVHDEFSYLLAADTFAHGRLTNPSPPFAEHFESFHILVRPTYSSMYPPAQGLLLAAGQVLGGQPIYGVWGMSGLLALAVLWALRGWLPGRWALLGALLVAVRLGFGNYWAQSYWGGYAAAVGGALVVGGIRRILDRPRVVDGLLTGFGAVVLANSRPYEGLVLCLGAGVLLLVSLLRSSPTHRRRVGRIGIVPLAAVLLAGAAWTGIHNRAVTGSPWRFPYLVHAEQYVRMPFFVGQDPRPSPGYSHPDLATFHEEIEPGFAARWSDYPGEGVSRLRALASFFLGRTLFVVALGAVLALRRRRVRCLALWSAGALLGHFMEGAFLPHYAAPMTVLVALLFALGARAWSSVRLRGLRASPAVALVVLVGLVLGGVSSTAERSDQTRSYALGIGGRRPGLVRHLSSTGPRHLVIVGYGKRHSPHQEWVYNHADIEASSIVWARDMGEAKSRDLMDYFRDRTVWRLTVDWDQEAPTLETILR